MGGVVLEAVNLRTEDCYAKGGYSALLLYGLPADPPSLPSSSDTRSASRDVSSQRVLFGVQRLR